MRGGTYPNPDPDPKPDPKPDRNFDPDADPNPNLYPNQAYNFYKGCSILYAYPFIFLPIVRGHLVATADAGAPLELGLGSGLGSRLE